MRLRAEIWVKAYLRICASHDAIAVVVRHGDDDAGAVFIRQRLRDGSARLFGPAPAGLEGQDVGRTWVAHLAREGTTEEAVDSYLERQYAFDPDIWILEVDDRDGRHFLDDWLVD